MLLVVLIFGARVGPSGTGLLSQTPPIHPRLTLTAHQDLDALTALLSNPQFLTLTSAGFASGAARGTFGSPQAGFYQGSLAFGLPQQSAAVVSYSCSLVPLIPTPPVILTTAGQTAWWISCRAQGPAIALNHANLLLEDETSRDFLSHVLDQARVSIGRPFDRGYILRRIMVFSKTSPGTFDRMHAVFDYSSPAGNSYVHISSATAAGQFSALDIVEGGD